MLVHRDSHIIMYIYIYLYIYIEDICVYSKWQLFPVFSCFCSFFKSEWNVEMLKAGQVPILPFPQKTILSIQCCGVNHTLLATCPLPRWLEKWVYFFNLVGNIVSLIRKHLYSGHWEYDGNKSNSNSLLWIWGHMMHHDLAIVQAEFRFSKLASWYICCIFFGHDLTSQICAILNQTFSSPATNHQAKSETPSLKNPRNGQFSRLAESSPACEEGTLWHSHPLLANPGKTRTKFGPVDWLEFH